MKQIIIKPTIKNPWAMATFVVIFEGENETKHGEINVEDGEAHPAEVARVLSSQFNCNVVWWLGSRSIPKSIEFYRENKQ